MGEESANYSYEFPREQEQNAMSVLTSLGAVPRGDDLIHWVFRGRNHWIDLEFDTPPGTIQFRIALSNPPDALEVLRKVFEGLLDAARGRILDLQRRKYLRRINPGTWRRLVSAYELKKATGYAPIYGDFVAAVSAEDLFAIAEERGHVRVIHRGSSIPTGQRTERGD